FLYRPEPWTIPSRTTPSWCQARAGRPPSQAVYHLPGGGPTERASVLPLTRSARGRAAQTPASHAGQAGSTAARRSPLPSDGAGVPACLTGETGSIPVQGAPTPPIPPWPSGDGTSLTRRESSQVRVLPGYSEPDGSRSDSFAFSFHAGPVVKRRSLLGPNEA